VNTELKPTDQARRNDHENHNHRNRNRHPHRPDISAANDFRLIDNDHQQSLVVPWCPPGEEESPALKWLNMLDSSDSNKAPAWLYRKLQRYSINLPEQQLQQMYNEGAVNISAGCYLLVDSRYHPKLGVLPPEATLSAEQSVL